jgi:hypothetical protein
MWRRGEWRKVLTFWEKPDAFFFIVDGMHLDPNEGAISFRNVGWRHVISQKKDAFVNCHVTKCILCLVIVGVFRCIYCISLALRWPCYGPKPVAIAYGQYTSVYNTVLCSAGCLLLFNKYWCFANRPYRLWWSPSLHFDSRLLFAPQLWEQFWLL